MPETVFRSLRRRSGRSRTPLPSRHDSAVGLALVAITPVRLRSGLLEPVLALQAWHGGKVAVGGQQDEAPRKRDGGCKGIHCCELPTSLAKLDLEIRCA